MKQIIKSNQPIIAPYTQDYIYKTSKLLSENFTSKGVMETALHINRDSFYTFINPICTKCGYQNNSFIAVDESNTFLGALLNIDGMNKASLFDTIPSSLKPISDFLSFMEEKYGSKTTDYNNELVLFIIGVSLNCHPLLIIQICIELYKCSILLARVKGYKFITSLAVNPVTEFILNKLGFIAVGTYRYQDYKWCNNHVFNQVLESKGKASYMKLIL